MKRIIKFLFKLVEDGIEGNGHGHGNWQLGKKLHDLWSCMYLPKFYITYLLELFFLRIFILK